MINLDVIGLRTAILEMMQGERKPVNVKAYKKNLASLTSLNQVFTLLVHLGYLTYDAEKEEVFIPNRELMEEFATATSEDAPMYLRLKEIIRDSVDLLKAT